MEYILVPTKDHNETLFFKNLFKKMNKKTTQFSSEEIEEMGLLAAMKESEKSGKASLSKVMSQLNKVIDGK